MFVLGTLGLCALVAWGVWEFRGLMFSGVFQPESGRCESLRSFEKCVVVCSFLGLQPKPSVSLDPLLTVARSFPEFVRPSGLVWP